MLPILVAAACANYTGKTGVIFPICALWMLYNFPPARLMYQRAVQIVKKAKGHTCEVCGFNFEETYGELGKDFIEIHHLVPISELRGLMVSSHPEHDYAALCSNCHSMIHRMKVNHDIEALRARLR